MGRNSKKSLWLYRYEKRGFISLNPDLSPSSASKLVIDRADRRFAPARDYFNHGRLRFPDRGAIEYLR